MKFFKFSDMKLEEKLERTPFIFFYIISSSRDIVLKEVQNGTKSGSPIVKILVKLWQKGAIFVISLGSGQLANYEISYNLAITYSNQLKLCGQKVLQKRHKSIEVFVIKATVSVPRFILYMDTKKAI